MRSEAAGESLDDYGNTIGAAAPAARFFTYFAF